jgi:hypothetical protein
VPRSNAHTNSFWTVLALVAMVVLTAVPALADGRLSLLTVAPTGSMTHDVDVQDGFLYVAADGGLTVMDISTPAAPVIRGRLAATGNMGIKVRGQYAYLASPSAGLRVVDIGDPDAPRLVATRSAYMAYDIALKDDVVYVVSFAGELFLFDVSNPLNPVQVRVLGLPAWRPGGTSGLDVLASLGASGNAKATGMAVKGNVLAAVDWGFGRLYVWDITTAHAPVFRGTHFAPYLINVEIDAERDVIYMLSAYLYHSGLYTVPISSLRPDVSTTYSACPVCGYIPSVVPAVGLDQGGLMLSPGGSYVVYGGGRSHGELNVVDVRDPLAMQYAAPMVPIGPHGVGLAGAMGIVIDGDQVYFAAGTQGVQVYEFPGIGGDLGAAPPRVLAFTVNGGAASTTGRVVTLDNTVSGAAVEYRAGETSDLAGAAWLPYAWAPSYTLSDGTGTKQVYFQVRNADGLESQVKVDSITLEAPVPTVTAFVINGGAAKTTSRTVTLDSTATNGATEYRASESPTFAGAAWRPYTTAPTFELSAGNVTKRVYFQTRNVAGESLVRSDTIALAEPAPVLGSLRINKGYSSTTSRIVTLDNVASGDPVEYRASESSTFAGAAWLPYSAAPTFELSAGKAAKRVYLQLRNAAGVLSIVRNDTIQLY